MTPEAQNVWSRRRLVLAGCAAMSAAMSASCARRTDLAEGESGRVARISDGDQLALDTGQTVRLVEIEAPSRRAPYAAEAGQLLRREALSRRAKLWYGGLSRDRYDRALAHVIVEGDAGGEVWLNGLMVREGAARVRTWPDNVARARRLYALEQEARAARRGLWALDAYPILDAQGLALASGFQIAEGVLASVEADGRYGAAVFGPAGIVLRGAANLGQPERGLDLRPGARLRIRGRVRKQETGEVSLDLSHWAQVEALDG